MDTYQKMEGVERDIDIDLIRLGGLIGPICRSTTVVLCLC